MLAGPRIDEEPENVFHVSSRINSTWGGNLVDMVRCAALPRDHRGGEAGGERRRGRRAPAEGAAGPRSAERPTCYSNARGRGLMCAMDLPDGATRDAVADKAYELGMVILGCGPLAALPPAARRARRRRSTRRWASWRRRGQGSGFSRALGSGQNHREAEKCESPDPKAGAWSPSRIPRCRPGGAGSARRRAEACGPASSRRARGGRRPAGSPPASSRGAATPSGRGGPRAAPARAAPDRSARRAAPPRAFRRTP